MSKGKICFIVSDADKSHHFEALFQGIQNAGYEVSLIFISETLPHLFSVFQKNGFSVEFIRYRGKFDMLGTAYRLYKILDGIKPDVVHTHLFKAAFLGLPSAKLLGIKNRIQTRHHSNESHLYYPHAVKYDRLINRFSSHIIAISENVRQVLIQKENADPKKVILIHHGFDFEKFVAEASVVSLLKEKYCLGNHYPVIGVISRFSQSMVGHRYDKGDDP